MRALFLSAVLLPCGCASIVQQTDRDVAALIRQRQSDALAYDRPAPIDQPDDSRPRRPAYDYAPSPTPAGMPAGFEPPAPEPRRAATQPAPTGPATTTQSATQPSMDLPEERPIERYRSTTLTLTEALAYAQQHRREYQNAKEDLYLAALALTLERHLWTPQFSGTLRTVYGNFGEVRDFDQAMRFMAELGVSQRLPYGGEFTAQAISTLIRDVGRSITAVEGSSIELGLRVPFLRGAGHVAREELIRLERELTYAVRTFERFRRRQLVIVAQAYFNLLASKQSVIDAFSSVQRAYENAERARAVEVLEEGNPLDTDRAVQRLLSETNRLAQERERFRFAADQFKLEIGMPVDEPLGLDDLEDIESIERLIEEGRYPLLLAPRAAQDEQLALGVAQAYRLDLLNVLDRIDDARRGVGIAENAMLPTLDWNSTLTFDTDPEHYRLGAFEFARATWRTELVLAMNDRFSERTRYRRALVDVRRSQRNYQDQLERVRVDVRRALNQVRLQQSVVEIQERNLYVANRRLDYAMIRFDLGEIGNRDVVEAEDELVAAQNGLNAAKTGRWSALLDFRLTTGTLRVDESGVQHDVLAPPTQPVEPGSQPADRPATSAS